MPVPTQEQYIKMLDTAKEKGYAYPAVNVTTIEVINGALKAFAEAKSDGIIQVSLGGGQFASGTAVKDSAIGAIVLAEATHRLAEKYDVLVALHTDHCQADKVDSFLRPLLAESKKRIAEGKGPLFNSHMLDASALPMAQNLELSKQLLAECAELGIVLEIEIGVVGGEEDGVDTSGAPKEKLYTSPEDMLMTYETLNGVGEFMLAATFGNVHGVYKPGAVKLKPTILRDGQAVVKEKHGNDMRLVFHGGSGSDLCDIREAISYGVVKMNIDTDTQYAFSKPIVLHMCQNIDGMLKVDVKWATRRSTIPAPTSRRVSRVSASVCRLLLMTCSPPARPSSARSDAELKVTNFSAAALPGSRAFFFTFDANKRALPFSTVPGYKRAHDDESCTEDGENEWNSVFPPEGVGYGFLRIIRQVDKLHFFAFLPGRRVRTLTVFHPVYLTILCRKTEHRVVCGTSSAPAAPFELQGNNLALRGDATLHYPLGIHRRHGGANQNPHPYQSKYTPENHPDNRLAFGGFLSSNSRRLDRSLSLCLHKGVQNFRHLLHLGDIQEALRNLTAAVLTGNHPVSKNQATAAIRLCLTRFHHAGQHGV